MKTTGVYTRGPGFCASSHASPWRRVHKPFDTSPGPITVAHSPWVADLASPLATSCVGNTTTFKKTNNAYPLVCAALMPWKRNDADDSTKGAGILQMRVCLELLVLTNTLATPSRTNLGACHPNAATVIAAAWHCSLANRAPFFPFCLFLFSTC
eukprot:1161178-Pelagomonas_calceolata.AAC.5